MSGGWNTIESDAGVFTSLIEQLGVKGVQFEELISIDEESLQALSPIYGVIFLFKYPTNEPTRPDKSNPQDGTFDYAASSTLFFASQVIQNACGTQALLSLLLNNPSLSLGEALTDFRDFTISFDPSLRGETLSNSPLIRDTHNSFARSSPFIDETARRPGDEDADVYHFIAYASIHGSLYELDGLQPAPTSHGSCSTEEFAEKVVPVLRRRIERYPSGEIRFNLLAMTRDLREVARERGEWDALEMEEGKRRAWAYENALRKHNFLGFAREILVGVCRDVSREEGGFERWVEEAKGRTMERSGKGENVQMEVD